MSSGITSSRRVYQDIADDIAKQIIGGELADGAPLPSERELTKIHGVSRNSVREALLTLQSSGLVSLRQRARARVTKMSNPAFFNQLSSAAHSLLALPNGMADFQEARVLFECGLARYAARHASPKEIDRMALALATNKQAIGDADLFAKTDVAFHDIIAEIPRNPVFAALNAALSEWLMSQRTVGISGPSSAVMKNAYRGHKAVFEAIADHDAEAADRAMAGHLEAVSRYYWKAKTGKGQ